VAVVLSVLDCLPSRQSLFHMLVATPGVESKASSDETGKLFPTSFTLYLRLRPLVHCCCFSIFEFCEFCEEENLNSFSALPLLLTVARSCPRSTDHPLPRPRPTFRLYRSHLLEAMTGSNVAACRALGHRQHPASLSRCVLRRAHLGP